MNSSTEHHNNLIYEAENLKQIIQVQIPLRLTIANE